MRSGLGTALSAIVEAVENGRSRKAREAMSLAALLSGLALANSGLGMAHGVAAALGIHCRVAHGVACAMMLPVAIRVNRQVCETEFAILRRVVAHAPFARVPPILPTVCRTKSRPSAIASAHRGGFRRWELPAIRFPRL